MFNYYKQMTVVTTVEVAMSRCVGHLIYRPVDHCHVSLTLEVTAGLYCNNCCVAAPYRYCVAHSRAHWSY